MKTIATLLLLLFAMETHAVTDSGQSNRIVSVGLFKNGLALVAREYTVSGAGNHEFVGVPDPIHGTLWIDAAPGVLVRTGYRETAVTDNETGTAGLAADLVGRQVRLEFREDTKGAVSGTLLAAPGAPIALRTSNRRSVYPAAQREASRHYVVSLPDGNRVFVDPSSVASVRSESASHDFKMMVTEPVLSISVPETQPSPSTVRVTYITRGISWAPSYRIDTSDPEQLQITQSAVLRNELEDLDGVSIDLISGFPSIEFANVTSPLSTRASWATFFQQLTGSGRSNGSVVSQQSFVNSNGIMSNGFDGYLNQSETVEMNEGTDIYYHPIGIHALRRGEAMSLMLATSTTSYEPVVEWTVSGVHGDSTVLQDDLWDGIRFRNPFDFPMTTGPSMVVAGGRFLGSRTTHWVNPGGETLAYVTKALSVRVEATEEESAARNEITFALRNYAQSTITGTLTIRNMRNEEVSMIIHKELQGHLVSAAGEPESIVGRAGPGQLNPSTRLTWRLSVPAGEQHELNYQYHYIVR